MDKDDREVLTFRDKLGIVMTSLGTASIILGIVIMGSWFFMPIGTLFPTKPWLVLTVVGMGLIRLSLFTIKK